MTAIGDTVTGMQNATAQQKVKDRQTNGPSQDLDQDAFLMLMMEQMKNQDPMNPMDNSQMLTQQAQFTQISEMQKMNSNLASNNMISQATSLVGKEVTLVDPDDTTKTIKGIVTSANFTSSTATVTVNGKEYPLGLVMSVGTPTPPTVTPLPIEPPKGDGDGEKKATGNSGGSDSAPKV